MPIPSEDLRLLRGLQDSLDGTYSAALAGGREVILVGQPVHRNLGDTLIFEGQLATLARLGVRVRYRATIDSTRWEEIRALPKHWPILCHGGGNFGDLYPLEHRFREAVVREFPDRKIIFLPNTVHFQGASSIREAQAALAPAKDLTLMMRARRSEAFAKEHFGEHRVLYCIDSALGVDAGSNPSYLRRRSTHPSRVHLAARADCESRGEQVQVRPGDTLKDMPFTLLGRPLWTLSRLATDWPAGHLPSGNVRRLVREGQSRLLARFNLHAFPAFLRGAGVVATNRLHVHVYCALAGIPHVVADNSYGKVSEIFREYTGSFSTAHWADSLQDAYEQAVSLAESCSGSSGDD